MATYNKFNSFTEYLSEGVFDFNTGNSHTYKVMLTNTAPVAGDSLYGGISANEVANGNGYTTKGATTTITNSTSGGVAKILASDVSWTGSGAGFGPFRYVVIFDDTPTSPADPLIAWYDHGSSISLAAGDTFTVDFDGTNGFFTVT